MKAKIETRLAALESRPENAFPRLTLEYEDGHRERFLGLDVVSHTEGVKRVYFDGEHQASVDAAALYAALNGGLGIEIIAQ